MEYHGHEKVRLSVDCTKQERMYIKMLAARKHITISEYLLNLARNEMPECEGNHCSLNHEPNEETAKVLRESEKGENLIEHKSIDEFWSALGFRKNA